MKRIAITLALILALAPEGAKAISYTKQEPNVDTLSDVRPCFVCRP